MKQILFAAVAAIILIAAFGWWKKKYGHKNTRPKAGVKGKGGADLATQCYGEAKGAGNPKAGTEVPGVGKPVPKTGKPNPKGPGRPKKNTGGNK